jgi:hypothetical protein
LHEFIRIAPFAPTSAWVSCTIKAIIAPRLCVPLLLGLPFLTANQILIDFASCTAIDKHCNYDLLNPPARKPNRVVISNWQERKIKKLLKEEFGVVLLELISVCHGRLAEGKCVPEDVKPLNVAALVKDCIELLAFQEKVGMSESELLAEFQDVFEPLPHVDKLPTNVTARIKIKNAEYTIKTRTYHCPQNFQHAWQTLIQQHLNAGHIQPSSSPHAFPTFIILKSDPSVLP